MLRGIRPISQVFNLQTSLSRSYHELRKPKECKNMKAAAESLASRGFLRPQKPYAPPADSQAQVTTICSQHGLNDSSSFDAPEVKFTVLKACFETFNHGVPNSLLHTIQSVADLKEFYQTPVDTTTPFDALLKMDLPKNMYIQKSYIRFHPDTDTKFNGKTAFPKSSTLVTGLATRKKYQGFEAKRSWP